MAHTIHVHHEYHRIENSTTKWNDEPILVLHTSPIKSKYSHLHSIFAHLRHCFVANAGRVEGSGRVVSGKVGFMGPPTAKKFPKYEEVCTGLTQHVEVYDLEFDGDETTYENLVKHFFMFHDPTTFNRQGFDMGTQYASAIFVYDEKQVSTYFYISLYESI